VDIECDCRQGRTLLDKSPAPRVRVSEIRISEFFGKMRKHPFTLSCCTSLAKKKLAKKIQKKNVKSILSQPWKKANDFVNEVSEYGEYRNRRGFGS
jgi:hypothetical protein